MILVAISPAVIVLASHPTWAQAKCDPNRTDNYDHPYQAGWIRDDPHLEQISSDILNYSPWVQPDQDTGYNTPTVLASVMFEGYYVSGPGYGYAQAGWIEYPYSNRYTFSEYSDPSATFGYVRSFSAPLPVGESDYYGVNAPGNGYFTYTAAGSQFSASPQLFAQSRGAIFGEVHTLASQMPSDDFSNSFVNTGGYIDYFNGYAFSSLAPPFWSVVYSPTEAQIADAAC